MQRVYLKKLEKYFDSYNFTLVVYYHKDLLVNDIYMRLCNRYPDLIEYSECPESEPGALFIGMSEQSRAFLILNQNSSIGILAHESNHVAMFAFANMGTPHTEDTDEPFCHLSQHIFEFVLQTVMYKFGNTMKNLLIFD